MCFVLAQMTCYSTTSHLLFATVYKEVAASFHRITNGKRTRQIFTKVIQCETLHLKANTFCLDSAFLPL